MSPITPSPQDDIELRTLKVIAKAMDRPLAEVTPSSSLEEDLGAQSLDFLDIAFSLEREFLIQFPRTDFLQRAADHFGEENLIKDGVVTGFGLRLLRLGMPELDLSRLKPGQKITEVQKMFTVATFIRVVRQLIDAKNAMDRKCPGCGALMVESSALPELVCSDCRTSKPLPSGDEVLFQHLLDLEGKAGEASPGAS